MATVKHFHAHAMQHCCIVCTWSCCRGAVCKQFVCKFISFLFSFSEIVVRCLKCCLSKRWLYSPLDEDEKPETSSKKPRKHWVRPWQRNRQLFGCYYSLFRKIKRDTKSFRERVCKNGGYSVRVVSGSINPNDFERRCKYDRIHETTWNGPLSIALFSERRHFPIIWIPRLYLVLLLMIVKLSLRSWDNVV